MRREVWAATAGRRGQQTHAFRHGFITGPRSVGVDLTLMHYLVGHKDSDISDTYTHWALMEKPLRAAVAKIPPLELEAEEPGEGSVVGAKR